MDSNNTYYPLDKEEKVVKYIKNQPLLKGKFSTSKKLIVKDLADGNLNLVFAIHEKANPENKILIKQALPHLRVLKEWKLIKERLEFEAKYYAVCNELSLKAIPEFFGYDQEMCVIMMEYLDNHIIFRKGMTRGIIYPDVGKVTGEFLAKILYQTSDFHQDYHKKVNEVIRFANPHLCVLTHMAIFTNPYLEDGEGNIRMTINPLIHSEILALRTNSELKSGVMEMKYDFMNKAQALLHGDLHSGSLMVNEHDTRIIDPEFCFYGPMGFDLGHVIGTIFLNYTTQFVHIKESTKRQEYQKYLLKMVQDMWVSFQETFEEQWEKEADVLCTPTYRKNFYKEILQDSAGYAGSKMIRRVARGTTLIDFLEIIDERERAEAISLNLEIGKNLVLQRKSFDSISDLIRVCVETKPIFKAF
jgi:5-methylthioribose kinase